MMLPPPCFTVGMVPGFLQMWHLALGPKSWILVSSDQRILFLMFWDSLVAFWQTPIGLSCAFYWEWLPSGHSTIKAWLVECCRDGWPSGRYSHLHRGSLDLCLSDHRVLGHLPDQGPSPPIAQFGWAARSRKSFGGSKLPFKIDGGHCVLGDLQCCRHLLVPFPRSVPQHNPVPELYGQFLRPHGLVFALTCTGNCGTLHTCVWLCKSCPINWIYHSWTPIKL